VELNLHSPIRLHGEVLSYEQGQIYRQFTPYHNLTLLHSLCSKETGSKHKGRDPIARSDSRL